MSSNPDNEKLTSGKLFPMDLAAQKITIIKGTASVDSKVPHLVSGSKITGTQGQLITHALPLSLMRPTGPTTQIISHGMSSQAQIVSSGQTVSGAVIGSTVTGMTPLLGTQIISQGTQGTATITGQTAVRTLPPTVRLMPQHLSIPTTTPTPRPPITVQPALGAKQITTSYHVPRGPATVASLAGPRGATTPRATTAPRATAAPSANPNWTTGTAQLRTGTVVYAPRQPRPHTLQVPTRPTMRQVTPQVTTATVVARAVRPANVAVAPQRTPTPPQGFQGVTTNVSVRPPQVPKVVPIVQRSYQPAKVVGVTLGVRPTLSPRPGSTYYYELSSGPPAPPLASPPPVHPSPGHLNNTPPMALANSFDNTQGDRVQHLKYNTTSTITQQYRNHETELTPGTVGMGNDSGRSPNSPGGLQRPSILRKRDNEGSPMKIAPPVPSPPPSPGGSTTVSAASSPGPDDDESPPISHPPLPVLPAHPPHVQHPTPSYNNCSPRKKPRKQLLISEVRSGARSGDCEFPDGGSRAPSPPPAASPPPVVTPPEKPPRRALLGAGWRCGWRATALHFTRPSDVRRREERRPSVVELAAQRRVLQKANGWKLHHLTAQMDDLGELEAGVLQQAAAALRVLESKPQPDLHRLCELLKGNIQRSKIVGEGVAEARSNVLRVFQHKEHVSDILARQADKRCFKKHRNQC